MKKITFLLLAIIPFASFSSQNNSELINHLEKTKAEMLCLQNDYEKYAHPFVDQLKNDPFLRQHFDTLSDNFFSYFASSDEPLKSIFNKALYSSEDDAKQLVNHIESEWCKFLSTKDNPTSELLGNWDPNFVFVIEEGQLVFLTKSNMLIEHIINKIDAEIKKLKNSPATTQMQLN